MPKPARRMGAQEVFFHQELARIIRTSGIPLREVGSQAGITQTGLIRMLDGHAALPPLLVLKEVLRACHVGEKASDRILQLWADATLEQNQRDRHSRHVLQEQIFREERAEQMLREAQVLETRTAPLSQKLREDVKGYGNLKPDPLTATSKETFLQCMRDFHVWAKELSYREISRRSGYAIAASTLCEALNPNKARLPSMKVVEAFIAGCGGSEADLTRWTTAWRQIRMDKMRRNLTSLPADCRTAS